LYNRHFIVGDIIGRCAGIRYFHKQNTVNIQRYVVFSNRRLGENIQRLLFQVSISRNFLYKGDNKLQTRAKSLVVPAHRVYYITPVLRHEVNALFNGVQNGKGNPEYKDWRGARRAEG
jgi:hypothetical protein